MPKGSLPPNLIEVAEMPDTKVAFIQKHLNKDVRKGLRAKKERLRVSWDRLLGNLERTQDMIDMIVHTAFRSEDADFAVKQDAAVKLTMSTVGKAKVKSLKDAMKAVEAADAEMITHHEALMNYMTTALLSGRDMDKEDAIALAKVGGLAKLNEVMAEVDRALAKVKDAVKAKVPVFTVPLGIWPDFESEMRVFRSQIEAIPQRGDTADLNAAQSTLGTVETSVNTLKSATLVKIDAVANDPRLDFFAESLTRRVTLDRQMPELEGVLDILNKWDCIGFRAIESGVKKLGEDTETYFKPFSDLQTGDLPALEAAQKGLIDDAKILITRGQDVIKTEQEQFEAPKRALEQELAKLEARMAAVRKTVDPAQRAPAEAFLAALRTAIVGLGGCNLNALKPAQSMMPEATQLVGYAENIKDINAQIVQHLKDANDIAKTFSGKTDPLAGKAAELRADVAEFAKTYKTLPIGEAMKTAQQHKESAEAAKAVNATLVTKRAEMQAKIDACETALTAFGVSFKAMMAHAGQDGVDYSGGFRADLDTCISWNSTKTDPEFYTTLTKKLDRLKDEIAEKEAAIQTFLATSYSEQANAASIAGEVFANVKRDLESQMDGETDPAKLADLKSQLEAARATYDDKSKGLDMVKSFNEEIAAQKEAARLEAAHKEKYLADAADFLKTVASEIKRKDTVLHDYADEVTPQIQRVKATYDLVRKDKPGANGSSGLSELDFVERFVQGVRDRGHKTDKSDLAAISDQWNKEVRDLGTAASVLVGKISDFEDVELAGDHKVSARVNGVLNELIGRVSSHAFATAGTKMATAQDRQAVKAARELALSEVRRCKLVLLKDPVFQKCVLNPFKSPIGSTAANRLEEIELNVLRGV